MRSKKDAGFSLVEVVIIIAIMVTFLMLLLPMYFKYIEKSKEAVDVTNLKSAYTSAEAMMASGDYVPGGSYLFENEILVPVKPDAYTYGVGTATDGGTLYIEEDGSTTDKYDSAKSYKDGYIIVTFPLTPDGEINVSWAYKN